MSDVTESVDVNVPVSTAYNQWTQFESFPLFMEGVESVTQTDELHTHWVTSVGGARREFDAKITEQYPNERIAWNSVGGDAGHAGLVTFHQLSAEQTRVTVQLVWEPQGVVEKVGSMLHLDAHQIKADTKRFKEFIEQQGAAQGGDIVEILLSQHEEVKRKFVQVLSATGGERGRLFSELADLLHTHETGEQQVVHPVTRLNVTGGRKIAADRLEEEQRADQALGELKSMGVDHPDFAIKLDTFHQAVLAHATAEEEQEFPRLTQLPPHRRQAMAVELRAVQSSSIPN
ncbi:cyclase/dehydrase [Catenulispora acidiphila DSM 44928]|uniref:Cyclase/dehydrase n=1 Tax=Catenulispora acidiphila (strain DSM 44928 / JCM 14897 / NBRC 102108 / NRRL B-24433 / ID139908) TaxID=479433 RepID=C7PY98_CATAD|nr:SRPBCC family protein [Catenulispora acidiphila]ACU75388.1 cyclase/dehydrase [Catenulispora acidiphila DSM 44928]